MDILFKPIIKAFVTITSVFISGLLCSAIINSITIGNEIHWNDSYKHKEFWIMILYCLLLIVYTFIATKSEIDLRKNVDNEYFVQLYKQNQIGLIVSQQNQAIQSGDLTKFDTLDSILNKVRSKGK